MKVSVIVPVFNAESYLRECLDSAIHQDIASDDFEVVAIDDGSTDGSGEILDEYAGRHHNVRVVHQENSGWPGRPRNVGIDLAAGDYVFFLDADDRLAPEALRRMCAFADEHDVDVLVPRVVYDGGRPVAAGVWRRTRIEGDLRQLIVTLGPWKLFKRRFLNRQGLRFPEGKVQIEDGIFVTQAYVTARRVSVLADYDYYFKRRQPDRGNISSLPVDPTDYTSSIATMLDAIRRHCPDPALESALVAVLYRRKVLKWFARERFARYSSRRRAAWVAAVSALTRDRIPAGVDEQLPWADRICSVLVRAAETEALRALAEARASGRPLVTTIMPTGLDVGVPGLTHGPLTVTGGLRLVTDSTPRPTGSTPATARATFWSSRRGREVIRFARRRLWPVARRSTVGRRAWVWVRNLLRPGRA